MRKLVIDITDCVLCDICIDMCPKIFVKNQAGYIEIVENLTDDILQQFKDDIDDVIKSCRGDCISWE